MQSSREIEMRENTEMKLERTASPTPEAVLCHGHEIRMFPWKEVLALRELVAVVPAVAATEDDFPSVDNGPWRAASGNPYGIVLLRQGMARLFFTAEEWREFRALLYVASPLLSVVEVAALAEKRRQQVTAAILCGDLFAFLRPGLQRRRWLIPLRVIGEWVVGLE